MNLEGNTEKYLSYVEDLRGILKKDIKQAENYWDNLPSDARKHIMQNPEYQDCRRALRRTTQI
jgi:hypothetical protein